MISNEEAGNLRDFVDYKTGSYRPDVKTINKLITDAGSAAKKAGIDIQTGSPSDIGGRVYGALSQRTQANKARSGQLNAIKKRLQ